MFQLFIDREEELEVLEERFRKGQPEFIVIYGRRRVGKTELVVHFIKNKPGIYLLSEEKRYSDNLDEMKRMAADFLEDEEFKLIRFENWVQMFKSFSERIKERTVIIIDEFPYLVRETGGIPSEFQKIWDMHLSKSENIMLILVGSSIGMMEELLGRKSPLFGRRTAQLEIKPVDIFQVGKFLPGYDMEDCIKVYGCSDGIPLYLKQFDAKLTPFENIKNAFFRRDAPLYSEAEFLMKQEFREPANYFLILKAVSFGNTKQHEIVNYTNIDKSIISKYIQNLEEIRVIRREYPVTERKETRKSARYAFSDNYFRFWFRFVYPNKTLIERGSEAAFEAVKKEYNTYLGGIFEKAAKEFLWKTHPFDFTKLGRWWRKDKEIDIVALNDNTRDVFFFECKWRDMKEGNARKILSELQEKSKSVDWNNNTRKEHFGVIAKYIENKDRLKKDGYFAYDLADFSLMHS